MNSYTIRIHNTWDTNRKDKHDHAAAHGAMYFENLQKGLGMYPNCTIKLDAPKALDIFRDLSKKNGQSNSFVNFYSITVKLNTDAMLFSTFYFTNPSNNWWGNYNEEYIVFEEKENISTTHILSKENNFHAIY